MENELAFNLSNAIYVAKQQEAAKSQNVSRPQQTNKPRKYTQRRVYMKLVEPYEVVLKTLLANNLLTLPPHCPSEVVVKPSWWREDHFCEYHWNRGHNTKKNFQLKDAIQDLIDSGTMFTNGLAKNFDHKVFKTPLLDYDKGESSQADKKNHDAKIHYTYATNDNAINMV